MSSELKAIMENYKGDELVTNDLQGDIEKYLELDRTWNGKFELLHCEYCEGPLLGRRQEKCRTRNEDPYQEKLINKRLENKLRNVDHSIRIKRSTWR